MNDEQPSSPTGSCISTASSKRGRGSDDEDNDAKRPKSESAYIAGILSKMVKRFDRIDAKLEQQSTKIDNFREEIAEFKITTNSLISTTEELKTQSHSLLEENKILKASIVSLEGKVNILSAPGTSGFSGKDFAKLAAESNANSICLNRLLLSTKSTPPEAVFSRFSPGPYLADPSQIVKTICKMINFDYTEGELFGCRLLEKKTQQPDSLAQSAAASIAVKCANTQVLRKLLSAAKAVPPVKLAALKLPGIDASDSRLIYVGELLSSQSFKLLGKTKHTLKPLGFKYIWAAGNLVYAKKNTNELRHTILNEEALTKLAELYNTAASPRAKDPADASNLMSSSSL